MRNYSKRILESLLLIVLTGVLLAAPVSAKDCPAERQRDAELMTADVALARPVGVAATVTGLALFVISSPFSALGGNSKEAWESLVVAPADYTFKRPLGSFDCEQPPRGKER